MTRIRISRMAAIGAAFFIAAATLVPDNAEARRSNWWVPGAIIGGIAAGAIIANSARPRGYYYEPGSTYYRGPDCYLERQRVFDGYRWRWQRVRVCY